MGIILFRTISSIFFVGGLVMTSIGGWYDYQQTITMPEGPFGLNILIWGIITGALGGFLLIGQMWYKIWKLENPKAEVGVYPHYPLGKEIKLIVHNKTKVPVSISANMTCETISEPAGGRALPLITAPMGWESSGSFRQEIDPDSEGILKLCQIEQTGEGDHVVHWINFYKVESEKLKPIRFMGHESILTVQVLVCLNANLQIKGQREWIFDVSLIPSSSTLSINTKNLLGDKSSIWKIFRLDKFQKRIS